MNDIVNSPDHYIKDRTIEPIDCIEDWELPYHLGQVIKYVSRFRRKGEGPSVHIIDLHKARFYLDRYIEQYEFNNIDKDKSD